MPNEILEQVQDVNGVRYAVEHGSNIRAVFDHNASTETISRVDDLLGCPGLLGATQERLPCAEYDIETIRGGADA